MNSLSPARPSAAPGPRYQKSADKAYRAIYGKILDGTFVPGAKLSMRKMATLAQTSTIPVIEALNRLAEDGLVEARPQWGYFVAMPTRHLMHNQLIMREAVECQVARILNADLNSVGKGRLRQAALLVDNARNDLVEKGKGTQREVEKIHYDFHMLMVRMTGFESLIKSLDRTQLLFILIRADSVEAPPKISRDWHTQLVESIITGTPDQAERVMRRHVQGSYETILSGLADDPLDQ